MTMSLCHPRPPPWIHRLEADATFLARSLAHIRTRTDAMTKHAIMKMNPLSNEPVRSLRRPIIVGPKNPPMLAVQLIKPTAAAAADAERKELGNAQKDGK